MPNWKHKIDLSATWQKYKELDVHDEDVFKEFRDQMVKELKATRIYKEDGDFDLLVEDLESTEDIFNFNFAWDEFYDYCDAARIWINIFG